MIYSISRALILIFLKILFRLDAKGIENVPRQGGFILASNHASNLDPLALGAALPRKLNFMAKDSLFKNPLLRWWLLNVGAFPVKRESADISALREAMRRIKDGNGLLLFPEGTRRSDGTLEMPQGGIGFLAYKLNVPVIPAFISGTQRALPRGSRFIRPVKVSVHFGKPRSFYCVEALSNAKERDKQISIERRVPYQDIAQDIMKNIRHLSCEELN